ncbi:MAG: 3-oxoacyl-[acyl-carrier-protein] reductase [Nitrospinae bacterium]|nr:3-oxoacyl-[acyl-carrier-protein] reductase [Nitrospinota bacterium]
MKTLGGKTALITGGSRGIGLEIVAAFAEAGANVFLTYNNTAPDEALRRARAFGAGCVAARLDVSKTDEADAAVKQCVEKFGGVDVLVNNAGITRDGLLMRMKDEDWDAVMYTNLKGAFNMMRAASRPMMKKRFGRIINVGSVVGSSGNPGQANYCASKAGLIGLTKSAARELASRNILVNVVAPGFITTDMTDALAEDAKKALLDSIPLGRFGAGKDVAGAALFLASDAAGYVTGQVLHVNGGLYM